MGSTCFDGREPMLESLIPQSDDIPEDINIINLPKVFRRSPTFGSLPANSSRQSSDNSELLKILKQISKRLEGVSIDKSLGCEKGITFREGIYSGQFKNGLRFGIGIMNYKLGGKYYGFWDNDLPNGSGQLIYSDEEYYHGEFRDGWFHGYGRYQSGDDYYEGFWKKNRKHGKGEEYVNGNLYKGEFKRGDKHGSGYLKSASVLFEGEFKRNNIVNGRYVDRRSNTYYKGEWRENSWSGIGVLKLKRQSSMIDSLSGVFNKGTFTEGEIVFQNKHRVSCHLQHSQDTQLLSLHPFSN